MGSLAVILGVLAKALGLADLAAKLFQSAQDKQAGRNAQQQVDLSAALAGAKDAQKTRENVAVLSDAELDSELRRPSPSHNP